MILSNSDDGKEKKYVSYENDGNDVESKLLKQTNEEEKARRRTRGPYRKSSRSIITAHD